MSRLEELMEKRRTRDLERKLKVLYSHFPKAKIGSDYDGKVFCWHPHGSYSYSYIYKTDINVLISFAEDWVTQWNKDHY